MTYETVSLWLAVFCTLAVFSFMIKENPVYRLFEHIFVGIGVGIGVYYTIIQVILPKWWDRVSDFSKGAEHLWYNALWVMPAILGCLIYLIYSKKYAWIARCVIGFNMGVGAGSYFRGAFAQITPQVVSTFRNWDNISVVAVLENILFVVMFFCVMIYFFFSFRHDVPVIKQTSATGRWVLMISFGALFGSTVMGRMSLLIQRLQFLLRDWLGFQV